MMSQYRSALEDRKIFLYIVFDNTPELYQFWNLYFRHEENKEQANTYADLNLDERTKM